MDSRSAHFADDHASRAAMFVETRFADYFARLAPRSTAMSALPADYAMGRDLPAAGASGALTRLGAWAPDACVWCEVICLNTSAAPHGLRDVIAEAANQLVGAVCARLAADLQTLALDPPTVSVGRGGSVQPLQARWCGEPCDGAGFDHCFGRRLSAFDVEIGCRLCVAARSLSAQAMCERLASGGAGDGDIEFL